MISPRRVIRSVPENLGPTNNELELLDQELSSLLREKKLLPYRFQLTVVSTETGHKFSIERSPNGDLWLTSLDGD